MLVYIYDEKLFVSLAYPFLLCLFLVWFTFLWWSPHLWCEQIWKFLLITMVMKNMLSLLKNISFLIVIPFFRSGFMFNCLCL